MKITTPEEMGVLDHQMLNEAVAGFERALARKEKGAPYYHLVIEGEYSRALCDAVEEEYAYVGWNAICGTSTENGERPGLTGLKLSVKEFED